MDYFAEAITITMPGIHRLYVRNLLIVSRQRLFLTLVQVDLFRGVCKDCHSYLHDFSKESPSLDSVSIIHEFLMFSHQSTCFPPECYIEFLLILS